MASYYGGLGPMLNAVLWVQVVISLVFVGLRIYTRSRILHSVGPDDYLVMTALVLQIIYSAFVTAGTKYGVGRRFNDIGNPDAYFKAVELEVYSQVAGILLIGVGKSWFVVADFAFAILPWFVIWELNMKRKEKITVACGLSLGIFAGVCGIVRTVALDGLNANEYIYDTVDMLIWSATESTATIMCSSIPVLRPLYVRFRYGSKGDSSGENSSYKLPMYGNHSGKKYGTGSRTDAPAGPSHQTVIAFNANNASDESILRDTKTQNAGGGITRTDEVSISYGDI
ncbi:hypothetical protein ACHAPY_002187 [Fusarium culmorum]